MYEWPALRIVLDVTAVSAMTPLDQMDGLSQKFMRSILGEIRLCGDGAKRQLFLF